MLSYIGFGKKGGKEREEKWEWVEGGRGKEDEDGPVSE